MYLKILESTTSLYKLYNTNIHEDCGTKRKGKVYRIIIWFWWKGCVFYGIV